MPTHRYSWASVRDAGEFRMGGAEGAFTFNLACAPAAGDTLIASVYAADTTSRQREHALERCAGRVTRVTSPKYWARSVKR